jgi:hypothetical protein
LPILLLAALLGACESASPPKRDISWLPPADAGPTDVDRAPAADAGPSDVDKLLEYHQRALTLKGQELTREYDKVRIDYDKDASDLHRMRLALMLTIPGSGFRDDAAAVGLLQPILKGSGRPESSLRPLAQLLQSHLLELRRVDDALLTQSAKLRDEQRRAEALQQKLEALLEMEMKMMEREQSAQPAR